MSDTVCQFPHLSRLNIYGPEATAIIDDLFTSYGRGLAWLRNVLRLCAAAKSVVDLEVNSLKRYATFLCIPRAAVCLLLELGLGRKGALSEVAVFYWPAKRALS